METHYLTYDEYVDSRNKQDTLLNHEFTLVRHSIADLDQRFNGLESRFDGLESRFDGLESRFDGLESRFDGLESKFDVKFNEMSARQEQLEAFVRNSRLRNPNLPIRPVVALRPFQGIVEPDPSYFPRHANEFYSLRNPATDHQRQMLAYLADFYDILRPSKKDGVLIEDPYDTVDLLEGILGLEEDRFIQFRERARHMAARPHPTPIKRSEVDHDETMRKIRRRLGIDPRHSSDPKHSSDSTKSAPEQLDRLEWGTPPSERLRLLLLKKEAKEKLSDKGSTTNPFSSPRELSEE
ncbi:hypothetical protein HD806DRAFT_362602 [Xylariaceae sp. AK1471]|nr:hypothetical protein HD806DRAFT_362602 [Xylariaceae sp. AK1471]